MRSSLVLAALALLAACTPADPIRYYALTPVAEAPASAESPLAIGVAPITLASYLDRSGIVTRTSANELGVSSLHNWIEPLDTQARRVVARNLAQLLGTDRVFLLPEQRLIPLDYTVEIAIERFDVMALPETAEEVVLEARWTLFSGEERRVLQTAPARIVEPVAEGAGFERRAAAMSGAIERLSRTIATTIAGQRVTASRAG